VYLGNGSGTIIMNSQSKVRGNGHHLRFEVLTTVNILTVVFRVED
jgi:hypothetical protein